MTSIIIILNTTNQTITIAENNTSPAAELNSTINISDNISNASSIIGNESTEGTGTVANQTSQNQTFQRKSQVDFYFLLQGKAYLRDILAEQQEKIYNISSAVVTVQPIFISADKVIFQVNNYTTRALAEREWGSFKDFEIYVSSIYYRR